MPFGDHPPHHPIISCGDRRVRKLKEIREEMRQRMHAPVREQHRWLCQVLRGHYRYYGVIFNCATAGAEGRSMISGPPVCP
jgi:hypothetical protein